MISMWVCAGKLKPKPRNANHHAHASLVKTCQTKLEAVSVLMSLEHRMCKAAEDDMREYALAVPSQQNCSEIEGMTRSSLVHAGLPR